MKHTTFVIIGTIALVGNAFATGENIVATKSYVDTKQDKITAHAANAADSVLTDSTTTGVVGKKAILTRTLVADYGLSSFLNADDLIPTAGAVAEGLGEKQNEIAKSGYRYWYNSTTNAPYNTNAASDAKSWLNANVAGTGLVTRTSQNGVVGERKIFESTDVSGYHAGTLTQNEKDIQDISIPTVGAMMSAITNGVTKITWSSTETTAVQNYSTTFDGTTNNWPAADAGKLVDGTGLATALAEKQNKIAANNSTTYPNGSVVTYGATAGTPGQVAIATAPSYNQTTGALENGTQIATIAAVDTMQAKITAHAANAADSVLTDSATAGTVQKRALYDGTGTYTAATDAGKIATAAAIETRQKKRVCVGWATGHENDDDYCYFWDWPD